MLKCSFVLSILSYNRCDIPSIVHRRQHPPLWLHSNGTLRRSPLSNGIRRKIRPLLPQVRMSKSHCGISPWNRMKMRLGQRKFSLLKARSFGTFLHNCYSFIKGSRTSKSCTGILKYQAPSSRQQRTALMCLRPFLFDYLVRTG